MDTNVIVYAHDSSQATKQAAAIAVLDTLRASGRGFVSTQVLGETYLALQRLSESFPRADARRMVEAIGLSWSVLPIESRTTAYALHASERFDIHYWDAQIWAAAYLGDCAVVITEDTPGVVDLDGVTFANPFEAGFDVERLLGA